MKKKMSKMLAIAFAGAMLIGVVCVLCSGEEPSLAAGNVIFEKVLTEENFYDYEIRTGEHGEQYALIKGINEAYRADFGEGLKRLVDERWKITFPKRLGGAVVTGFCDHAFRNIPLGDCNQSLELSSNITYIGEGCFENCGLVDVMFEKEVEGTENPAGVLTIGDGAFAGNPQLWGIYFRDREVSFGRNVFAGCAQRVYLCYRKGTSKKDTGESHVFTVEIPAYYSPVPLVDYPENPYLLKPEVRNFFYGENGESVEEGKFCTLEYDDKAPDYGFPEWHAPCGEFCAMAEGKCDITASSELQDSDASGDAGADGYSYPGRRYEPDHLNSLYGREYAWAEGVDGNGIGESIGIISSCSYQYQREWYEEGDVSFLEGYVSDEFSPNLYAKDTPDIYDGYMRYTEICVVNGYAKNQKTWEENGRVKRLLMYVEDKPFAYLELEDTIKPQYFTLPVDAVKAADKVEIHFRFVIEDVYPGTKYEDTCLTGLVVEYMGRRGH